MAQTPPPPPPPPPPDGRGGGALRPRGIGDILTAAFDLYKEHWATLFQIVAIVVIPLTLLQYLLTDQVIDPDTFVVEEGGNVRVSADFGRGLLITAVAGVIGVLVTQVLTGAITRAAAGSLVGDRLTASEAFRYGFARLGSIILVGLLVGLIVAGGLLLFIIPGLIFGVKLAVSIPSLVVENRRGTDAISRSWNLTTGHFWHVLGTYIVAAIIAAIVSGVLTSLGGENWFVRGLLASVAAIITTPFTALVLVLIYIDLRVRKEQLTEDVLRRDLSASGV
jgi:Membrane domain of glycerophosphoryl diester phosphodiesterase